MFYLVAPCQPVLALWRHIYPISMRGDNSAESLRSNFRLTCYNAGRQEEQEEIQKAEGACTSHSNQNRDFGGKMHNNCVSPIAHCGSGICACRPGPHRFQRQWLVKIISPGERKHTCINYWERGFQRLLMSSWSWFILTSTKSSWTNGERSEKAPLNLPLRYENTGYKKGLSNKIKPTN